MAWLGRPDEVVVRRVDLRQQIAKRLSHSVGELGRRFPGLLRGPLHLLAVLVGACEKQHVIAHQAVRASKRVRDERGVRVTQVRRGVDVVDRRRDVEARHCVSQKGGAVALEP